MKKRLIPLLAILLFVGWSTMSCKQNQSESESCCAASETPAKPAVDVYLKITVQNRLCWILTLTPQQTKISGQHCGQVRIFRLL